MTEFQLKPQLRNNCVVAGKKKDIEGLAKNEIIFLISDNPTKTFSIITKIEDLRKEDQNVIYIDKRNLGKFSENDKVKILKTNPAVAKSVYLAISEKFTRIFAGEWTSIAKTYLKGKILDFGNEISFLIPWKDENENELPPIPVSGIINSTIPPPPVTIGDKTKLFLKKYPELKIEQIILESFEKKENRVDILEKEVKRKIYKQVQLVKKEDYPSKSLRYKFKQTNPSQLFATVNNIFKDLKVAEKPKEQLFESEDQDFLASAVYYSDSFLDSIIIADLQIISNDNSGELIIWITGKENYIIDKFIEKYDKRIRQIKGGLEKKAKLLIENCPSCGAKLPLDSADSEGKIKCKYCMQTSILPKSLRY